MHRVCKQRSFDRLQIPVPFSRQKHTHTQLITHIIICHSPMPNCIFLIFQIHFVCEFVSFSFSWHTNLGTYPSAIQLIILLFILVCFKSNINSHLACVLNAKDNDVKRENKSKRCFGVANFQLHANAQQLEILWIKSMCVLFPASMFVVVCVLYLPFLGKSVKFQHQSMGNFNGNTRENNKSI